MIHLPVRWRRIARGRLDAYPHGPPLLLGLLRALAGGLGAGCGGSHPAATIALNEQPCCTRGFTVEALLYAWLYNLFDPPA